MTAERWIIAVLLPALLASCLWCRNLSDRLGAKEKELTDMKAEAERLNAALAERERKLAEAGKSLASSRRKLKEMRNDKAVADWSDAPVPPAIGGLLKGKAGD